MKIHFEEFAATFIVCISGWCWYWLL